MRTITAGWNEWGNEFGLGKNLSHIGSRRSALLNDLVSYWKLDEASGTRNDSHGTNHLTDNNTVTQATGKIGDAGQFTRVNSEYLSVADNTSQSIGDIDFTFTAWIYFDSVNLDDRPIISKYGSPNTEFIIFNYISDNRLSFIVSSNGSTDNFMIATGFGAPSLSTWYFIVAWHDSVADTINLQINDGTIFSKAHTGGIFDGTLPLVIGGDTASGTDMDGRIDEVGFWKRVLTAAERTSLYNGGAGLAYPF